MHGNVAEMCLDVYVEDIDVAGGGDPLTDPVGALYPAADAARTKRGGWANENTGNAVMRSSNRNNRYNPGQTSALMGLRVVCPAADSWK
jgi:formylglycine-generating enzyme required for sulfatase activity